MRPTLLILRPESGAAATARRAEALGFASVRAPLFVIRPCRWDVPDPAAHDALIVTSANAIRHAGPPLARFTGLPLYAVGAATAATARAAGFATVIAGDTDAVRIAARAVTDGIVSPLHLAGREHRPLSRHDMAVATRIVYAAEPLDTLPPSAVMALSGGAVALLHSPRAAALFRGLASDAGLDPAAIAIAAISPAALAAAAPGWRAAIAATVPTDDALLAAAARLCDQGGGKDG